MNDKLEEGSLHHLKNLLLTAFFILGILISISILGLIQVEKHMKSNLATHLQTTLHSNIETLNFWIKVKKIDTEVIAAQPEIRKNIFALEKLAQKTQNPKKLIESKELQWLRQHFGSATQKYKFVGFVLFDLNGKSIGALLDEPVGQEILKDRSDFFERSKQGETVISSPFKGEVPIPDKKGVLREHWPTMFVSTPIKDNSGIVKAVLSFRIRPETEFSELLRITRFGVTGETYIFSDKGLLFSDSRFNQTLRKIGLISKEPWSPSILNVYIKDPKVNLIKGLRSPIPKKDWPLTHMAASATLGGTGVKTTPYNDYRGVPVVGAWTWLDKHGFGITTEIDAVEALRPVYSLRKSFYALSLFVIMAFALGIFFRAKQIISEKKQHRKEKKALDEKLKNQVILDNVVDAIITIDEEGIIQTFNQGAKALFQYDKNEVIGQNIKILMPDPDRSQHDKYMKRYLSTGHSKILGVGREVTGLKKDGSQFPMDLTISKVSLHKGIIFAGIIRDISLRKDFESALIEAKKLSDEANKAKSSFLANMSHEIRTPLNGILGLTQLALSTDLNPVQNDFLRKIQNSSKSLLTIINDILDVSKVEAGKMEIEFIEFELEKILQDVSSLLSPKIKEKGLQFHLEINKNVPTSVIGDPVRLSQVLTNLFSNSVKFTEQGHITISLRLLEQTQETVNLEFSVQDSGIGISENHIGKLFKPFSQADASITRIFGGTGLGLNIARNLVRLMGGDIRIESKPGKGSNFIFNVKLKPTLKKEVLLPFKTSTGKTKVMVIDGSIYIRETLTVMLHSLGVTANAVSGFPEGLEKLKIAISGHPYDLVIIDNTLLDTTGTKICDQIKNINPDKETKTILISNLSKEDIPDNFEANGFDGFSQKPITLSTLFNMIQEALGIQIAKEILVGKSEHPGTEISKPLPGARILLAEDNKINQQVACGFLENAGLVVTVVNNGQEALDTIQEKEFDTVLMDIQMPVMDGYLATRKIRDFPQFQDLPIIALTANATIEDRKKALDCGMNEHISKPIDAKELIKVLAQFIPIKSDFLNKEFAYEAEQKEMQSTEKIITTEQFSLLHSLCLENDIKKFELGEELHIDLLIQFSRNQADTLDNIETAVENHDLHTAMNLAHGLKGVAGNLGAIALADMAAKIENELKHKSLGSDYTPLLSSAKQSMGQLLAGIENLKQQHSTNATVHISQPLPAHEELAPFIEKLGNMISDNNIEALSYLNSMEETFKETPIKDLLSPVRDSLSQYRFDEAIISLARLTKKLSTFKDT